MTLFQVIVEFIPPSGKEMNQKTLYFKIYTKQ